jgi:hypothetical protein
VQTSSEEPSFDSERLRFEEDIRPVTRPPRLGETVTRSCCESVSSADSACDQTAFSNANVRVLHKAGCPPSLPSIQQDGHNLR